MAMVSSLTADCKVVRMCKVQTKNAARASRFAGWHGQFVESGPGSQGGVVRLRATLDVPGSVTERGR
jgi:hypothetical protein